MPVAKRVLLTLPALFLALPVLAQEAGGVGVIWHDRGDAVSLDLTTGPGGRDHEPGTDFRFIEESLDGTSPKFLVEDEHGIRWKVKLGEEGRSETAAARLLWAAGYIVDDNYYRSEIRVRGLTRLARGQDFVSSSGTVTGARLERDGVSEESRTWSWYDNPFVGTREFNGLRVMMALINNWDLKEVNNRVSGTAGAEQYRITDLGATFGRTGNTITRSKAVMTDYAGARFIEKVTPPYVNLSMHSRPLFLFVFHVPNYRFRTRMESVAKHIPIADARWIGARLGQLSAEQIGDCFRAGGFSAVEVEMFTHVVMQRIAALNALDSQPRDQIVDARASVDIPPARTRQTTMRPGGP